MFISELHTVDRPQEHILGITISYLHIMLLWGFYLIRTFEKTKIEFQLLHQTVINSQMGMGKWKSIKKYLFLVSGGQET